jgi:alpha-1,2-mannosyltransferase
MDLAWSGRLWGGYLTVGGAAVSRPAGGSLRGSSGRSGRRGAAISPPTIVITVAAALALALRLYYQSTRPGFLLGVTEYDDGAYFGSAIRLVNGVLPYRDFVLVQPPGIALVLAPVALVAKATGTAIGLAIARVLTVLASATSVVLAGLLVRHRGLLAVLVTTGIMAVYPDNVAAAHTVLIEPWLALFSLIGALAVFDGDQLAGARRLAWGGVAFGFAGAVEFWAAIPVIVIFVLSLPGLRRPLRFVSGVAAGFLVPVLPFAVLAPRQFFQSVIVATAERVGVAGYPVWSRIAHMAGLVYVRSWPHSAVLLVAAGAAVLLVAVAAAAWLISRRPPPALEWFAVLTAGLVVTVFCLANQFYYHFDAFLAPFLAMTVALPGSRLLAAVSAARRSWAPGPQLLWLATCLAGLAIALCAAGQARVESRGADVIGPIPAAVDRVIPPGACVLTDQASLTILANRFTSSVPGCPQLVDGLGTDLALSHGRTPADGADKVPAAVAVWRRAFEHAQFVLLSSNNRARITWTQSLLAYFLGHFFLIRRFRRIALYARRGRALIRRRARRRGGPRQSAVPG